MQIVTIINAIVEKILNLFFLKKSLKLNFGLFIISSSILKTIFFIRKLT